MQGRCLSRSVVAAVALWAALSGPLLGEIEVLKYLAVVPGQLPGTIDAKRMARTIEVVAGAFELKTAVKPQDVYAPGMTNH